MDPTQAVVAVRRFLRDPRHRLWPESSPVRGEVMLHARTHGQVTDYWLVQTAMDQGGILATFDQGIAKGLPLRFRRFVHTL